MQALGREMLGSGLDRVRLVSPRGQRTHPGEHLWSAGPLPDTLFPAVSQRPSLNGQKSQGRAGGDRGWTDQGSAAPPLF